MFGVGKKSLWKNIRGNQTLLEGISAPKPSNDGSRMGHFHG